MTELPSRTNYWLLLLRLMAYISAGFVLYGFIAIPFVAKGADTPSTQRLLQFIGVTCLFLMPSWLFATAVGKEPLQHFKLKTYPRIIYLLLGVVLVFIVEPLIGYTTELNQQLSLPDSMKGLEDALREFEQKATDAANGLLAEKTTIGLISNLLAMAVLPAFAEEIFFRGVLQQFFIRWSKSIHIGVWHAAFWFSFLHLQFYGFLPRLILGVILGYLYVTSRSLWPNVLFHMLNNALFLLVAHFDLGNSGIRIFSEDYQFPVYIVVISFILVVVILVALHKQNLKNGNQLEEDLQHT